MSSLREIQDVEIGEAVSLISVIVPVYNAEKTIKKCVESLLNQDYPKDRYEIIVVDNNPTDNSIEIIKSYPIKIAICLEKGSYAARNTGARHANGEILAFTDADCEVSKNWLKEIDKSFKDKNITAVQGPGNLTLQKNLKVKVECLSRTMTKESFWGDTKNFAVRKFVFDDVGGFNSFITGCDTLFFQTLLLKKYNFIKFNENMIVFHAFPTDFLKLIKKNWKHGFGDVFIAKKKNRVRRVRKVIHILYNFRRSLEVFFLDNSLLEKIYMWLYYIIALDTRSLSYIVHSLSPKILFADKYVEERAENKRLKVAYVVSFFPKLSQSFVLNEIVELIRRHDVQIFSWFHSSETVIHEEIKEYQLLNRTHYFAIKQIFKKNPFKFLKYFVKAMMHSLAAKQISTSELKIDLQLAYFATIIEEKKIELIHAHFANMGSVARRLGKMLGLPYTLTVHAFDIYMDTDTDELRKVMDDAEVVITISDYNKNYLEKEVKTKSRIEVVRCGIDLAKFDVRERSRGTKNKEKIKLLCVGRLVEKKGIEYLIKALPLLLESVPDCELTIIGSGPLYKDLLKLTHSLGVEGNVYFKLSVSDDELTQYYIDSDIFVLPCVIARNGDRDGIPVSIMEAMAMGLPVISTNISGIPELVKDDAGILVPPNDEKAIVDAIVMLYKDSELRVRMGENGQEIVMDRFNVERAVKRLIKLFHDVSENADKMG